jgi:hypothetical protein
VEQRYRVDAYPISPSDEHEFPIDSAAGSRSESPLGAFVVLADHEGLYLIEDSAEGEVECRRLRRRFQKQDPNLKAKYRDLVFEHNELCNHYTDLQGVGGSNCKFTNTDLWLDAFTHDPVAMHLEGLTSGPKMGGFDHKKEMKHRFVIDLVVNEFEEHIEDEKEWLSMPHNVRQLCHAQESAVDYESPLAVEQESLLAALEL